jgi:putative transcriptional regulator
MMARAVLSDVHQAYAPDEGGSMSVHKQSPISNLRRRLQMTQEEFAHAIGVTVSTVNRWENGHIEPSRLARKAMEGLLAQAPESGGDFAEPPVPLSAKGS